MAVSSYSVIIALLWFTVAALIGCWTLRKAEKYGLVFISVIFTLAILRAVLPLEYAGSLIINSTKIYPAIQRAVSVQVFRDVTFGESLLILWGIGSAIQILRFLKEGIKQARFLRQISQDTPHEEYNRLYALLRRICYEFGYHGKWKLTLSEDVLTAYQAGFIHPHIVLPESITEASEQDICNVFRHEMQHFLGKHLWIHTGMQIAACLLWWNPVMGFMNRSVQQLLELLCDRRACKNLSQEEQYSYLKTLLRFLKNKTEKPANRIALSYVGNSAGSEMKQRFQLVLQNKPSARLKFQMWVNCILCIVLFVMSYLVIVQPAFLYGPLIHTNHEEYEIYYKDDFYTALATKESLYSPPYCDLPIIQENGAKP